MAGQIISRGKGTWLVRVFVGRDPLTGKREYDNKTVHGNKKEAEQRLTEMLRDRDQGNVAIGAKKRVIDVLLDDLLQDCRINGKRIDWARNGG